MSSSTMLIRYTGRKSGKPYEVPVNYVSVGGDLLTTSETNRVWWRNLRGGVEVQVHIKGKAYKAHALVKEGAEQVAEELNLIFQQVPQWAKYFNVSLDGSGQPEAADLAKAASGRVVIRTKLLE
jgi:deazaflavin-dependent oxidoreductase (nitroreductase family)